MSDDKLKQINEQLDELFDNLEITDEKKQVPNKAVPPVIAGIHPQWWNILAPNTEVSTILQNTLNSIANVNIKPVHRDIFNFARFTPPDKIKVIILGQDPYHTENHAHGLSFSSQQSDTPKSLGSIFKALIKSGFIEVKSNTNNLSNWSAQGVLLLNTALTVLENTPESHLKLWEPYMHELLTNLSRCHTAKSQKLVVILWGKKAHAYAKYFTEHHVLQYQHPSPLAGDFSGCPNFIECNKLLESMGKTPIQWNPEYNAWVEVYTDGSSYPNLTGPDVQSGYSAIFTGGIYKHLKIYGKTVNEPPYYSNNIRAEGTAIIKALQRVASLPKNNRQVLHLVTDCEFWIKMIKEHIPAWTASGGLESFESHKNPDIVRELWNTYCNLINDGTFITISHVYSHDKKGGSKHPKESTEYRRFFYNKLADSLANYIRQKFQNGQYGEMISPLEFDGQKF
jgi:uracil-DNA glycosylase